MKNKIKRAFSLLASGILTASLITGCGTGGINVPHNTDSTTSVVSSQSAEHHINARLISFAGKTMDIEYNNEIYTIDISKAIINTNVMHEGDELLIYYDGELTQDASTYTIVSVENKESEKKKPEELVGTLEEITMNTITLRTNDGRILTFNVNNAEHSFSYGVNEGNWVTVQYDGKIKGTDTSNISVTKVHDEDTEYVKKVKAQTTIEDVQDDVYALESVYVRSSYMMASEVIGSLEAGEHVKRTGHCNNGWDRIEYNGREAYVYGSLLTTNPNEVGMKGTLTSLSQKVTIKSRNEVVYAKSDANVRQSYSTASPSIGALKAGTAILRTGICNNGWSCVVFNDTPAFVYSDLLTTVNPNSEMEGVKIVAVNETVYAVTDANIRESFTKDSEAVGALKFGENVVRTGICDNGWSRIIYNNKDAYINSDLISKTNPVQVTVVKIYVTSGFAWATTDANVRESFTSDSTAIGLLAKGQKIEVTGVTDNNWTRVNYNGKTGYIHNDLLTSNDPNASVIKAAPKQDVTKAPTKTPTKAPTKKAENKKDKKDKKDKKQKPEQGKQKITITPVPDEVVVEDNSSVAESITESVIDESVDVSVEESVDVSVEESIDESIDESVIDSSAEEIFDESSESSVPTETPAEENPVPEKTDDDVESVSGKVVGYDIHTVTIKVNEDEIPEENDESEESSTEIVEEPEISEPEGVEDEYPALSYDEADGEENTYYTFDITEASQNYENGINEGNEITIDYTGDLDDMENVQATNVEDNHEVESASIFRGYVKSTTANTVTIEIEDGDANTEMTFRWDGVESLGLTEGEKIKVVANMNHVSQKDNIINAENIER